MTSDITMTTRRPYQIRATYEWIVDNGLTPHLMVNAKIEGVKVPVAHVDETGHIVLNVAPVAIRNFNPGLHCVTFNAAFPGLKADIVLPIAAIKAIYAMENGEGMMFEAELDGPLAAKQHSGGLRLVTDAASTVKTASTNKKSQQSSTPNLRVVKKRKDD